MVIAENGYLIASSRFLTCIDEVLSVGPRLRLYFKVGQGRSNILKRSIKNQKAELCLVNTI